MLSLLLPPRSDDYENWMDGWRDICRAEPMAHPTYGQAFCNPGDSPLALYWDEPNGEVLLPLIRRRIPQELDQSGDGFDLLTPYGYGGAYFRGHVDASAFWLEATRWAKEQGAVTLFARLSLFAEKILPFPGEVVEVQTNVVRDVQHEFDNLWMSYEHKVRKNVQKAVRLGVRIEIDETGERLGDFLEIYYGTMARRDAREEYNFPCSSFESILSQMPASYVFIHALVEDKVVSTELALVGQDAYYSFLGGTREEFFEYRPNDLLKHHLIQWGHEKGLHYFVMGGGVTAGDGIFRYKRSFAPEGVRPFLIGKLILDQDRYEALIAARKSLEAQSGRDWSPRPDYFPAYRDPS